MQNKSLKEDFIKGRLALCRLLEVVENPRESTFVESVTLFCQQHGVSLLNTDLSNFHLGSKKILKVEYQGATCYLFEIDDIADFTLFHVHARLDLFCKATGFSLTQKEIS